VLDITTPATPKWIKSVSALYGENVATFGKIAAITDYSKIRFYDVTNPAAPVGMGLTGSFKVGNEGFAIDGNYAYIPDGDSLRIFNISNLASPAQVGKIKTGGYGFVAVVSGKYAYVAAEGAGLRVIEVSNPAGPQEAGYYDGVPRARGVAVVGAFAYVAELADGLTIYRNDLATAVAERENSLPQQFALQQNYPNPFNPNTAIRFDLTKPSFVTLEVKNVLGQTVATLVNAYKTAGSHVVDFDASQLVSGVYWYRLKAGGVQQTRKMLLMR